MRLNRFFLIAALGLTIPSFGQSVTLPLWPRGVPEVMGAAGSASPVGTEPEQDTTKPTDTLIAGRRIIKLAQVSQPMLTLYQPGGTGRNRASGAAVVVFPGGGYTILAYDLEGTEVCSWLNAAGVACVLVKYRVPFAQHYPEQLADLQDAQRAMRLTRQHAAEWHIDPRRIGVLGFSAGGHLAAVLSIHAAQPAYKAVDAADDLSARPDFAFVIYPGYLATGPGLMQLAAGVEPDAHTPPTFLVQAEDDPVHEENALVYFQALKKANVPAELHIFAQGGHGYGLRPTELPVTNWPALAETWLHTIHVLKQTAK